MFSIQKNPLIKDTSVIYEKLSFDKSFFDSKIIFIIVFYHNEQTLPLFIILGL